MEQEVALKKVGLALQELQNENIFNEAQLNEIRQINLELRNLQDPKEINPVQYDKQLARIQELEDRKTQITEEAEDERLRIRLRALEDEYTLQKTISENAYKVQQKIKRDLTEEEKKEAYKKSEDLIKLDEERIAIQTQLETNSVERRIDAERKSVEEMKKQWERFKQDLFHVFDLIADKFIEMANKQVQTTQDRVQKQEKATDDQRARAVAGLDNTWKN